MFCFYCHQPCGDSGFCDDTCFEEHRSEMNCIDTTEGVYVAEHEVEDWDAGGL